MGFTDWGKLQILSRNLVKTGEEGMFRSAVNRSYYSAFHLSMSYAESEFGFQRNNNATDHSRILMAMKSCGRPLIKKAGRKLGRLKINRGYADYDSSVNISLPDAEASVILADEIIREFGITL